MTRCPSASCPSSSTHASLTPSSSPVQPRTTRIHHHHGPRRFQPPPAQGDPTALPPLPLPAGITSRFVDTRPFGLRYHVLEAIPAASSSSSASESEPAPRPPLVLLLHGFPNLAYDWRFVMPGLARAGYYAVAFDLRGFGRTHDGGGAVSGASDSSGSYGAAAAQQQQLPRDDPFSADGFHAPRHGARRRRPRPRPRLPLRPHPRRPRPRRLCRRRLRSSRGATSSSRSSSWRIPSAAPPRPPLAQRRPRHCPLLTSPDKPLRHPPRPGRAHLAAGPGPAATALQVVQRGARRGRRVELPAGRAAAARVPPRLLPSQVGCVPGRRRGKPRPLGAWTAERLAVMPHYYIMRAGVSMRENVALDMAAEREAAGAATTNDEEGKDRDRDKDKAKNWPPAPEWLTERDLDVYTAEWSRTTFADALRWYASLTGNPAATAELRALASGRIAVPTRYVSGVKDWGTYQDPGALEAMEEGESVERGATRGRCCWRGRATG
ncbi:hypothetical protein ACCO45_009761 [Purpureocillium lilacinum]|uniref:Uncharacterized protein n=1 Tax=Purpureocillium lilacinum TaxID=33203 RepID=A0ACC4DNL0_PURLI